MSSIRQFYSNQGLSTSSVDIIMSSWRSSTYSQYNTYIRRWQTFCETRLCNPVNPPVSIAIDFLTSLFTAGLSYSSINTARSALSSLFQIPDFGINPTVKRFMRGVFQLRPSLPRYQSVWNVHSVFNFIRSQPCVQDLSLRALTLRLTFLLCLLSGQRRQTIQALRLDHLHVTPSAYTFQIIDKLKQTRPGFHQKPIVYEKYVSEPTLCIYTHLTRYIETTASLRGDNQQLLISFCRPHRPVSADTISRWCKDFLTQAGIDTSKYKSHSTRAASTSHAANVSSRNLTEILMAAGWTNENTFRRFYNLPCDDSFNFGSALLSTL